MQLFKETNIDFIGRQRYFVALSVVLMVAGAVSMVAKGGLKLGIDFRGGTLLYVKFKSLPRVDEIRTALTSRGLSVSTLQPFEDGNELKVDLDLSRDEALSTGRNRVIEALNSVYPAPPEKLDLNNTGLDSLVARLTEDERLRASLSVGEIENVARTLIGVRDGAPYLGLIPDYSAFNNVVEIESVLSVLPDVTYLGEFTVRGIEMVGPKIGRDLQFQALKATLAALGAMGIYLAFRFEWIYGLAAVLAVFHDVFVTLSFFSFFDQAIDLNVVAALLTLVGYSVNDTIVIFDRVRENLKLTHRMALKDLMNRSVNQTLSRTVLTSALTFIPVLCLYLFGGEVLRGFSFALVVGVVVGSYSTIFVASPIVLWWRTVVGMSALGHCSNTRSSGAAKSAARTRPEGGGLLARKSQAVERTFSGTGPSPQKDPGKQSDARRGRNSGPRSPVG